MNIAIHRLYCYTLIKCFLENYIRLKVQQSRGSLKQRMLLDEPENAISTEEVIITFFQFAFLQRHYLNKLNKLI